MLSLLHTWEKENAHTVLEGMMLILARYPQEAIVIGEVRVTVLDIIRWKQGRPRVILGIDAPPEISILRAELPCLESPEKIVCQRRTERRLEPDVFSTHQR